MEVIEMGFCGDLGVAGADLAVHGVDDGGADQAFQADFAVHVVDLDVALHALDDEVAAGVGL
jgi:hypothetical protein